MESGCSCLGGCFKLFGIIVIILIIAGVLYFLKAFGITG